MTSGLRARLHRAAGWALAAGLGIVAGVLAVRSSAPQPAPISLPDPLRLVAIRDSGTYWERGGFVAMEAPVRPPTSAQGDAHIVVYLKLPEGAPVVVEASDGALIYPPGTIADRVEYTAHAGIDEAPRASWLAADVRGATISLLDQTFHVLRPRSTRGVGDLVGVEWPRSNDMAQGAATTAVGQLLESGIALAPRDPRARAAAAEHLRGLNDCRGCHLPRRAPRARTGDPGVVSRGSDGSGFFHVSTVLSDRAPLETYRPRNANAGDPFVHFVCGPHEDPADIDRGDLAAVRCREGWVPIGVLDLAAALAARDPHALKLCASRWYLYRHLDETGKRRFADAARECAPTEPVR